MKGTQEWDIIGYQPSREALRSEIQSTVHLMLRSTERVLRVCLGQERSSFEDFLDFEVRGMWVGSLGGA